MNQPAITRMLIENLADRYIPRLQFDPHRSIRKLVDLGECLSNGTTQKQFFQAVQKLLEKENAPYYTLVQRIISQVDPGSIKTIGMNLSLNSWISLADRKCREAAPPWTLLFQLENTPGALSLNDLTALLSRSKAAGIHTFLFWADRSYEAMDALMDRVRNFSDCAIAFFTPADLLNKDALSQAGRARNILISIEDGKDKDPEPAARALRALRRPYALHTVYNNSAEADNILCGKWLERVSRLFSPFAFFFPGADCPEESHLAVREYAKRLRTSPQQPVFSMSLCDDVADVDMMISGTPRLLRIGSDGLLTAGSQLLRQENAQNADRISLHTLLNQYISPLPAV